MANGLLSPVEQQTQAVFGMVPMQERLSILPRYSSKQGMIAPQFLYDLAKAVSTPIVAMRGQQVSPEESVSAGINMFGMGGVGTAPKGSLRTFIGRNAKTWDKTAEAKFLELEKSGASPEDIWRKTGTFRAPDNQLRQEISDAGAEFKMVYSNKPQKLGDALSHDKLFQAYPEMKNIEFTYTSPSSVQGFKGGMSTNLHGDPSLILSQSVPLNKEGVSTVLHEGGHFIQNREGWSPGGTSQMVGLKDLPKFVINKAEKLRDKANSLYEQNKLQEAQQTMSKANKIINDAKFREYQRMYGEAEARLIQNRIGLTDEELKSIYPLQRGKGGLDVNKNKIKVKSLLE